MYKIISILNVSINIFLTDFTYTITSLDNEKISFYVLDLFFHDNLLLFIITSIQKYFIYVVIHINI